MPDPVKRRGGMAADLPRPNAAGGPPKTKAEKRAEAKAARARARARQRRR